MKKILISLFLLVATTASADVVEVVGNLDHSGLKDLVTMAYTYDNELGNSCISFSVTKSGGAASVAQKCYVSANAPTLKVEKTGSYSTTISAPTTTFKVIDSANNKVCYGNVVTQTSYVEGGSVSSASASIDCL